MTRWFGLVLFLLMPTAQAQSGLSSWYSTEACRSNPDPRCPTASGDSLYDLEARRVFFAAMWDVPLGSRWNVCHETRCLEVIVLDRGPARRLGRLMDLSKAAFAELAPLERGVIDVQITPTTTSNK